MSARTGLTRRQRELLDFISAYSAKHGIAPSFDEMASATDEASKSSVHRIIVALEERGFIRRLPNRARAIEIVDGAPILPPEIESRIRDYCRSWNISRATFDRRAAEGLMRGWP